MDEHPAAQRERVRVARGRQAKQETLEQLLAHLRSPLREHAVERRAGSTYAAVAILAAPWWREMRAAMRWARHVVRRPGVPIELEVALADIRAALVPLARPS